MQDNVNIEEKWMSMIIKTNFAFKMCSVNKGVALKQRLN